VHHARQDWELAARRFDVEGEVRMARAILFIGIPQYLRIGQLVMSAFSMRTRRGNRHAREHIGEKGIDQQALRCFAVEPRESK